MIEAWLRTEYAATAYEDVGLEGTVTCATAALLASELLCAMCILAAVLGLGVAVTLVCEILYYVELDGVVVRLDAEYAFLKSDILSGRSSVDFQNW